jgi:toxin ParE1/3/4
MVQIRLSPEAQEDIEAILAWSHREFGEQVRLRYEELLVQAMLDLAEDPSRVGSQERPELAKGAKTYHIQHSRNHMNLAGIRIRKPRHFLLCRLANDSFLEIGRVLHDSMELAQHLPPDYQSAESESDE